MPKNKLTTPAWILEGYDSEADYNKVKGLGGKKNSGSKTFKIRKCPECNSFDVVVVTEKLESEIPSDSSESQTKEAIGLWRCNKCAWEGKDISWEEMDEESFMKYMDEKGEVVA